MITRIKEQRHVLLVDDDQNVSQMLKLLLESRGYRVDIARSAKEAFHVVSNQPDVILLDIVLPDLDGLDVCRKFKENRKTNGIPIIMLSGNYQFEDKIAALYLGADDYLTKPFEHEELFARMEVVMRRYPGSAESMLALNEENIIIQLRKVISDQLIEPHFQPIYYLEPLKLLGLEVLSHPKIKGLLSSPELLFRAALKYGLYHELELLAWQKALDFAADNLDEETLFFNCNPNLIEGPKFLLIKSIFDQSTVNAKNVILEITERSRITNYKVFYEHLRRYREYGFRFAVDDVGGGFASLESIVETRPEIVKIDRHITMDIERDPFKKSIVNFVVSFCRENNIMSIAEGIETKAQFEILKELGVDAGQGFFLYRPTPNVDLENMRNKVAVS